MYIPTPKEFQMKWLPKRLTAQDRQLKERVQKDLVAVVTRLKSGLLTYEVLGTSYEYRDEMNKYLNAAGWSTKWNRWGAKQELF